MASREDGIGLLGALSIGVGGGFFATFGITAAAAGCWPPR